MVSSHPCFYFEGSISELNKNTPAMAEQVESSDKSLFLDYIEHINDWALMQRITLALQIQIAALKDLL